MSKMLILQGVPASGKSTYAKSLDPKKWIRVNRDDIRHMMGGYMIDGREKFVEQIEKEMVIKCIYNEKDVCVDDTNLNPKTIQMWQEIADEYHVQIEFKEFKVSMADAIKRDSERESRVGRKVIENFFRKYYPEEYKEYYTDVRLKDGTNKNNLPTNKPNVILCDLDGTLALHNGRNPFEYDKIHTDVINAHLSFLLSYIEDGMKIVFVSGREGNEVARQQTREWLDNNGYVGCELLMRKQGDFRPDEEVKLEIYYNEIEPRYNVIAVFDDRDKVVKMWRENGLMCCQVYYGDF